MPRVFRYIASFFFVVNFNFAHSANLDSLYPKVVEQKPEIGRLAMQIMYVLQSYYLPTTTMGGKSVRES